MSRAKPVKAWNVHKGDRVSTTNGMREVLEASTHRDTTVLAIQDLTERGWSLLTMEAQSEVLVERKP